MLLTNWAVKWGIPAEAIRDLQQQIGVAARVPTTVQGKSESAASNEVRLLAAEQGVRLFRNNVGALKDERGRLVRFGLANETAEQNRKCKSGDLIGIRTVVVTPAMVGRPVGVFVSREVKHQGWRYSGAGREAAQKAWIDFINAAGGDAAFTCGEFI